MQTGMAPHSGNMEDISHTLEVAHPNQFSKFTANLRDSQKCGGSVAKTRSDIGRPETAAACQTNWSPPASAKT